MKCANPVPNRIGPVPFSSAPPVAEQGALVIAGDNVVRGQGQGVPPLKVLLANPLVIGTGYQPVLQEPPVARSPGR